LVQLAIKGNRKSYQYDASKNKINEYMYSDSVIIYGTYQLHHNVETSGAGICIEPFDGQAFADTIEKVYNMTPDERAKYGANARKYILENNTLEKLTEKYISRREK
jgi:glycosyltransferase involved in cell wall biosynthesis